MAVEFELPGPLVVAVVAVDWDPVSFPNGINATVEGFIYLVKCVLYVVIYCIIYETRKTRSACDLHHA